MLKSRFIDDTKLEVGLDEAGRGSFWGPLMAGAVILPAQSSWSEQHIAIFSQIKDSKKISPKKRIILANDIKRLAISWAVGTVSASDLDTNGISWTNQEAFCRAVCGLKVSYDRLIIDGTMKISDTIMSVLPSTTEQYTTIDGDASYLHIAAASILAKVEHDTWIEQYCKDDIQCETRYNLLSCKGYGTAKHIHGITIYGYHKHHRLSFIYKYIPDKYKDIHVRTIVSDISSKTSHKHRSSNKCLIQLTPV